MNRTIPLLLHWACRLFLGGVFIYAGYTKVINPLQFAVAVEDYRLLSPQGVIWTIKLLPWLEIVLGVSLLIGPKIRYTAAVAGGLLAFFIGIMVLSHLRGLEVDCGCFGMGEKISPFTLVRDSLLMLPAIFLVSQPWMEARDWLPAQRR